jgi:hypothetical protein
VIKRFELPNGDWIDLATRLNYAQAKRLNASAGDSAEVGGTMVAVLAVAWALRDVDDQPIEFPGREVDGIPIEPIGRIPWDHFQLIVGEAADVISGEPDPKGTAGTSPGLPSEEAPASPSSLPMPTSSQTIRAGRGKTSNPPPLM